MKKLVLVVLAVFVASAAFAGNWGLGLKLGYGQNDPKTMKDLFDAYGGTLDENGGVFAIEGQYEWDLQGANKLGLRFGLDFYGNNELTQGSTTTENTIALPLTVYYRWDGGVKAFSYYAGGGITYIETEMEAPGLERSESKWFPHVLAGAEYRFSELFALGIEAKYNISAEVKKEGATYSDRSGVVGVLVGRFYF